MEYDSGESIQNILENLKHSKNIWNGVWLTPYRLFYRQSKSQRLWLSFHEGRGKREESYSGSQQQCMKCILGPMVPMGKLDLCWKTEREHLGKKGDMAAILTHRESECVEVRGAKLGIISGYAQWVCSQDPHRRPQEVMSQNLAICHT